MADKYVEVTNQSYFQRLGNSFGGMIGGVVLIVVAIGLLWWNEGRAVQAERALSAARDAVVSLTSTTPDAANDSKLVHVSGTAQATAPVTDGDLSLSFANALVVRRKVEMYQWVERSETKTEERLGGGQTTTTTYSYEKEWSESRVDSSKFHRQGYDNPLMTLSSRTLTAGDAVLGGFRLSSDVLAELRSDAPAKVETTPAGWLPTAMGLYAGDGMPEEPQVGDMRVNFTFVESPSTVSIVARQAAGSFSSWRAANGYDVFLVTLGDATAEMMIQDAESAENTMTWILRAVGIVAMWIGFSMIFGPIKALANVVPFLAGIVGVGVALAAFALAVPISLFVIALAWLTYRPIVAVVLIVVGAGIFALIARMRKNRAGAAPPATPAGP